MALRKFSRFIFICSRAALGAAPDFFLPRSVQIYLHLRPSQYFTRVTNILFDVAHSSVRGKKEALSLCFHMQIHTQRQSMVNGYQACKLNKCGVNPDSNKTPLFEPLFCHWHADAARAHSERFCFSGRIARAKMPSHKSRAVKKRFSNNWNVCTKNKCFMT